MIDLGLLIGPVHLLDHFIEGHIRNSGLIVLASLSVLGVMYQFRDCADGRSPGKRLTDLQVLSDLDHQPAAFGQSLKRNAVFLLLTLPLIGWMLGSMILLQLAVEVQNGYRPGDKSAKTRVVRRKYANLPIFGGNDFVCGNCSYNLRGNISGTCPECGEQIPQEIRSGIETAVEPPT